MIRQKMPDDQARSSWIRIGRRGTSDAAVVQQAREQGCGSPKARRSKTRKPSPLAFDGGGWGGRGPDAGGRGTAINSPARCRCVIHTVEGWRKGSSLRRPKPLLEKLELLVDRLLGRFHLDEAVDEALTVGLDPLFKVGDLGVNFARLLG